MDTNRIDVARLPESLQTWIEEKISSGLYNSPEELIAAAINALEEAELRDQVRIAQHQIATGDCYVYDDQGLETLKREIREEGEAWLAKESKRQG